MRYIPTEKELKQKVPMVEVPVKGEYIAAIDERRKTIRRYRITVLVPAGFTKSDLKRQTPRVLREHADYVDFVVMRTFFQDGVAKKTTKEMTLASMYSERELARFAKLRKEVDADARAEAKQRGDTQKGIPGDTSEYDPDTGLPPVINDFPTDD